VGGARPTRGRAAGGGWVDEALEELVRLVAEHRARQAAAGRSAEGFLRRLAGEELGVAELFRGAAERGEPLVVTTIAARAHRGRVLALGTDFAVLAALEPTPRPELRGPRRGLRAVLVPLGAVAVLRNAPGEAPPATGSAPPGTRDAALPTDAPGRPPRPGGLLGPGRFREPGHFLNVDASFADALSLLASERRLVAVGTATGETVRGELLAASADVLAVREEGNPPATVYVRRELVSELSLFGSG
jgi:hypothetical protein